MPKLRHYDDSGTVRFITFSCYRRLPGLTLRGAKEILMEELDLARTKHRFQILGYVFMPEHVHLVIYPQRGMKLGLVIGEIKSRTARRFFKQAYPQLIGAEGNPSKMVGHQQGDLYGSKNPPQAVGRHNDPTPRGGAPHSLPKRVFWEKRCYDHNCRSEEAVWEKINYCHNNPVKRGLVDDPSDWRWSSYNWYKGERDVPLKLDKLEI
jgi:putative transposase